ncbi:MAG TPA: hypothetical protein VFS43_44375 [Polyangiaceae bacterium]|nr:hypothetical protein [Polyangiaceae bacterium]
MKRTLGGALLAAALGLGGCTPPTFVSPAQGGPKWSALTTRHFTLYTDVPDDEARETAREFEEIYRSFEDVAFPYSKKPTGRFEVTLFQREDAYRKVAPPETRGYFQHAAHDPDNRPMMVLYHGVDPRLRTVLRHELAHRFVAFYFPAAPRWLNEGLAKTYETLTFKSGEALVGAVPDDRHFGVNSRGTIATDRGVIEATRDEMPSAAQLVAADHRQFYPQSDSPVEAKRSFLYYEAAWNLVHAMRFGPPPLRDSLEEYLLALIKGRDPRASFGEALRRHGVTPAQLESAYRQHIELYGVPAERAAFAPRDIPTPHGRAMSEAEVRLLWARVRPWRGPEGMAQAGEEIEAAIKADPKFAPAYVLRGEWFERQRRDAEALADYRKARALAPEDFRTAHALASYLSYNFKKFANDAAVQAELNALLEGLRQNAGSAAAWDTLARYDARQGAPERGLPFAKKAISANPSCFECYDTAAMLLFRLGRLDEAVAAQRTAVNLMPDGVRMPGVLKRLRELEEEVASRPAAPPPADAAPANSPASAGP